MLFPKTEESSATGQGDTLGDPRFIRYAVPDSLSGIQQEALFGEQLNAIVRKIDDMEKKIKNTEEEQKRESEEQKKRLEQQSTRSVEVIGVFSSILALLITNVSIVKSADTFISAMLLIVALTCSVAIFSVLIHIFFSPEDKRKFGMSFWIPIGILLTFVGIGCVTFYRGFDLYDKGKSHLTPDSELRNDSKVPRSNLDIEMHDDPKKN